MLNICVYILTSIKAQEIREQVYSEAWATYLMALLICESEQHYISSQQQPKLNLTHNLESAKISSYLFYISIRCCGAKHIRHTFQIFCLICVKSKESGDYVKDMFHHCEDDLHLLQATCKSGSSLRSYYDTSVYKHRQVDERLANSKLSALIMYYVYLEP